MDLICALVSEFLWWHDYQDMFVHSFPWYSCDVNGELVSSTVFETPRCDVDGWRLRHFHIKDDVH